MMTLHNDVAGVKDNLGYGSYADAIAKFLLNAKTPPPLSISIQAPWGAGKSSLMHMIRERIDPKVDREANRVKIGSIPDTEKLKLGSVLAFLNREPDPKTKKPHDTSLPMIESVGQSGGRLVTIWFNAWMYETSEQIWSGLVDAIVSQISERLTFKQRETFLLRLQLARIDDTIVRRKIYDRIVTIWWARVQRWVLLGASTFAGLISIGAAPAPEALPTVIQNALAPLTKFGFSGAVIAQIILSAYLIYAYFDSKKKTTNEPAKFSLADYIKVPDYDKSVGEIHQIQADLRHVLAVTPKGEDSPEHSPIVIFIDDLDRCSPSKVASVVEGVNMLLAMEAYRCMFIIGMDPQMIAAALEKAHEDVRKQLPSYERSAPLGWRFMDKFVQLPFTIPPSRREHLEEFLISLGAAAPSKIIKAASSAGVVAAYQAAPSTSASTIQPEVDVVDQLPPAAGLARLEMAAESRDVGRIIRRVSAYSVGNPREVKRMVNLARLYLALRNERRNRDPEWRSPEFDHYARWIALSLRWPDMMRWLQWGADEVSWEQADNDHTLIARRLKKLEDATLVAQAGVKQWATEIATQLYIDQDTTVEWTLDPKLFEFFQAEAKLPVHERLSHAATGGFW
jgi:hypothetical protein